MNRDEMLQATFATYVMMARLLKDNNISTWTVYLFKAKEIFDEMNKQDQTNVINMAHYLKAA